MEGKVRGKGSKAKLERERIAGKKQDEKLGRGDLDAVVLKKPTKPN